MVHGAGPVRAAAACAGPGTAGGVVRQGQGHVTRQALHQDVFAGRELVEVSLPQALQVAGRHGGIEFDLVFFARGRCVARGTHGRQCLAHARAAFDGLGLGFCAGQHLRQQLLCDVGIAKVGVKQLAEHHAVLLAADQHGLQCSAEVLALQAHQHHRLLGQRHARSVHPHASAAQRAAKAAQVIGQLASAGIAELGEHRAIYHSHPFLRIRARSISTVRAELVEASRSASTSSA